jgi:translation initiation factor 2B subunit (eIF-2B alpha/beta/delta family)
VLVGADAVGPEGFINKVGTGALCALAESNGIPVYVLAGREKRLDSYEFAALELSGGDPGEVWAEAPVNVTVRNPYFELIPFRSVSAVISDSGVYNMSL